MVSKSISPGTLRFYKRDRLHGCEECLDFADLNADIAVGDVGSERGRSSVLARNNWREDDRMSNVNSNPGDPRRLYPDCTNSWSKPETG
jgi:hypothetical protein